MKYSLSHLLSWVPQVWAAGCAFGQGHSPHLALWQVTKNSHCPREIIRATPVWHRWWVWEQGGHGSICHANITNPYCGTIFPEKSSSTLWAHSLQDSKNLMFPSSQLCLLPDMEWPGRLQQQSCHPARPLRGSAGPELGLAALLLRCTQPEDGNVSVHPFCCWRFVCWCLCHGFGACLEDFYLALHSCKESDKKSFYSDIIHAAPGCRQWYQSLPLLALSCHSDSQPYQSRAGDPRVNSPAAASSRWGLGVRDKAPSQSHPVPASS